MFIALSEMGYCPVALYKDKKNPIIKGWQQFSHVMPNEDLLSAWEKDFKKNLFNIGVVFGEKSNLIGIDIDLDDKELFNIVPPSPIRKRGDKGEVRFFRFCNGQETRHFADFLGQSVLDILSTGTQTVLPPSIHPISKKPYVWLTPDTLLNTKAEDLPIFSSDWIPEFESWLNKRNEKIGSKTGISISKGTGNRNNQLKRIVTAMRARGCTEREVIEEIYNYDFAKHKPRLFTDPTENKKFTTEDDAFNNAARFYASINNSLINSGVIRYEKESKEIVLDFDDSTILEEAKKTSFKFKPYPESRGMMKIFQEICDLKSVGRQDATSLGGAISLMSVLASNKFVTKCRGLTTCPNTYVINLGYSSFGKEIAQDLINSLLIDSGLLGSGNYKSAVSLIMSLPTQQERLDIIDECSTILSAMSSKDGYASQIVELLSELFTKGASRYSGQTSMTNGERFGAAYNPHISFLGSTTPKGFRSSVSKDVAAKGLLPRMLLFFQNDIGGYNPKKDLIKIDDLFSKLKASVDQLISIEKMIHPDFEDAKNIIAPKQDKEGNDISQGYKYQHRIVAMSDEASHRWMQFEESCHNAKTKDPEGFESAFIGRFAELAAKLALLDAISLNRKTIEIDSLEWAIEVIETQWHNSKPLYEIAHAENKTESDVIRVLNLIKQRGIIDRTSLVRKCQWLDSRMFSQILNVLIETDQIEQVFKDTKGRKKTYYRSIG